MAAAFAVGPLVLPREKYPCNTTQVQIYADKCTESQFYYDCTYRQNSISEDLSEDVKLSIYLHFKMLNNMSRRFRNVLYTVCFHARNLA